MNNRIDTMFLAKKEQGKKALITFVTAGDPDLTTTKKLVLEMAKQGADLIELGVPYSDPIAEGPVIQRANERALKNDVRMDRLFELIVELRKESDVPLVFLMYVNVILQYGTVRFFEKCVLCGLDGVILPDLPFEESDEIHDISRDTGVYLISLVAPTSGERIRMIAQKAEGFLYCVSSLGVTGVRAGFSTDFDAFFKEIDAHKSVPSAVGFGISTPEQVKVLKGYCDGIIVGSAIVRKVEDAKTSEEAVQSVGAFTKQLKDALDEAE